MSEQKSLERALVPLARGLGLPDRFSELSPTEKLRVILDLPDPKLFVRRLRPDELYTLVRSIGIDDAWCLVLYGSKEQRQAICDLEVWDGDTYSPERLDHILDLCTASGLDHALQVVRDSDPELLALHIFIQARVTVARDEAERDEGEGEDEEASFLSPDGVFMVHCNDPEKAASVRRLLDLMYAIDVEFAQRIIFAGMYDTPSSLEHVARYFREKRLEDLGFPPPEERYAIWEPFDLKGLKELVRKNLLHEPSDPGPDAGRLPMALVLAQQKEKGGLVWDVLSAISDDPSFSLIVHRLLYLVNKVLAAETTTYHDDGAWDLAAKQAVELVSLGLEELSGGDPTKARQIMLAVHPLYLYRAGVEVLRPLNLTARKIVRMVGGAARLAILGEEMADLTRAMLRFPPQSPVLEGAKAWTCALVARVRKELKDIIAVVKFAYDYLGFNPQAGAVPKGCIVEPTLANVLATAWANNVLTGEPSPRPLTGDDIRGLVVAAFSEGRLRPSLRVMTLPEELTEEERQAVQAFVSRALAKVEDGLRTLDPGRPIDVRFVGDCLLVRK